MTDTERLDWLEAMTLEGYCPTILFDDDGRWTVSFSGWMNVTNKEFHSRADMPWSRSIREAIDAAKARVEAE